MRSLRLLALVSIASLTLNFQCEKEFECRSFSNDAVQFRPPSGCAYAFRRGETKHVVANSNAELAALLSCTGTPPTEDFTSQTIVAGRVALSGGGSLLSLSYSNLCPDSIQVRVVVGDGPTAAPTDVDYALYLPKVESGKVKVSVRRSR